MKNKLNDPNVAGEGSNCNKSKDVCSTGAGSRNPWPYRIKLTPDSMRWDSLKISPSREFQDHILQNLPEDSHKALELWHPIEVSIYDVDTHETYELNLAKKESFWFEPLPDARRQKEISASSDRKTPENCSDEFKEMPEKFAYSLQPFRNIVRKRSLSYDQEIGLHWSGSGTVNKIDFSVLYAPRSGLHNF
ncbi:uncharacterized protein LOC131175459 [Hevea brasiliensis]|uniref:uncharacterized protein LOC131175459 n=1 Tax=Hevea brasiliensis TaxID=3981 RepID=UPI0025F2BB2B|nr:uncharacterized protein LOC131175459 [Hevea brasiliensis]